MPHHPAHAQRYGTTAIVLHWLLAAALLGMLALGLYMTGLPFSPQRLKLYHWHKWGGIAVLALSTLRLLWRLAHRPPALPATVQAAMPRWQRAAHQGTHGALYLLFFAVPLLGWAYSAAAGQPIVFLGLLPLPGLVPADPALADALKPWHRYAAYALAALALLHVAAALKHHWVDRDGLLARMWPGMALASAVFIASLALGAAAPALAQQKLLPEQSEIRFVSRQMGAPVEGRFRKFDAELAFDPARPENSRIAFTVDIGSATLGLREIDAELPRPDWFDVARFPQARFRSSAVKASGGGRFEVAGQLTIKGRTQDILVPILLAQQGTTTVVTGSFTLRRLAFGVGENEWDDTSVVADEVQVRLRLALSGVAKP